MARTLGADAAAAAGAGAARGVPYPPRRATPGGDARGVDLSRTSG